MHVHFNSDDEDENAARAASHSQAGPSNQPAAAQPGPNFTSSGCKQANKCGSVRVDYDTNDQCYVFKVLCTPDHSAAVASLSNHRLKVYSLAPTQLTHTSDLQGHQSTITDIQFPDPTCSYAAYTSSTDGTIRGWDLRSGQQAQAFQAPGQEVLCFSMSDQLLVAGGQGDVLFWDVRSSKQLGSFTDTHMDDVTQVRLHAASKKLLSASQDGLIAVFDVSSGLDEDDGFISALNVNTSVEEMNFYGAQGRRLWVRTGTESLHLWEWFKASSDEEQVGCCAGWQEECCCIVVLHVQQAAVLLLLAWVLAAVVSQHPQPSTGTTSLCQQPALALQH
jgi:WD40 repeat protein